MDKKNLTRRNFLELATLTCGSLFLGACASTRNPILKGPEKPVKEDFYVTGKGHFHVLNKRSKKTGMYLEEGLYKKLSKSAGEVEEDDLIELKNIPGLENHYIIAGQGKATGILNNLGAGEGYMQVFYKGKPLDEVYISEGKVREICFRVGDNRSSGEIIYDGRFLKIPGTSLELKCSKFDEVVPTKSDGGRDGGNDGSGAGNGGASGGGGQGSGGGNSGGSR
ncbi:MAG: hypothetical protein ABIH28_01435 [archaeon]